MQFAPGDTIKVPQNTAFTSVEPNVRLVFFPDDGILGDALIPEAGNVSAGSLEVVWVAVTNRGTEVQELPAERTLGTWYSAILEKR